MAEVLRHGWLLSVAVGGFAFVQWHLHMREVQIRAEEAERTRDEVPAAARWRSGRPGRARLSNDEIAERMVLSPMTAKTHVSRAMTKFGARDRAQLVVFAYQSGLVAPRTIVEG